MYIFTAYVYLYILKNTHRVGESHLRERLNNLKYVCIHGPSHMRERDREAEKESECGSEG